MSRTAFFVPCVLSFSLAFGCAAEVDESSEMGGSALDGKADTAAESESNCSFIPGCLNLLEGGDGPMLGSVKTYEDAEGQTRQQLWLTYLEDPETQFLLCHRFPNQPPVSLLFIAGPDGAQSTVATKELRVDCPRSYGDNLGSRNSASFVLDRDDDPMLWDTVFPPAEDGSRWFALQVALVNDWGQWDSRYGQNYRLVLEPR